MIAIDIPPNRPPKAPVANPSGNERVVVRRKAAEQRAHEKAGIKNDKHRPPRKAVDDRRSDQSRGAGRKRIRGDDQAELCGADFKLPHQLRPERQDDHEVDDRRELHRGQYEQNQLLAALVATQTLVRSFFHHRSVNLVPNFD